ncbi:MAG: 4Fe-4S binding protein [Clostridiales bacterium]|nr:4Fe-4S binding protein [Clostridiales bacterium]
MKISKVFCAYFSPGGTTKKVVRGIGDSFRDYPDYPVEEINLTDYNVRRDRFEFNENHLLIIGAPAYGGRIPTPVSEVLDHFHGVNTPVVLVATYGNRAIDDTLMELKMELSERGFIPVAAASFVGQHTFLSDLAFGRPDEDDLAIAKEFGDKLKECLRLAVIYDMKKLDIPGSYPYAKQPMTSFPFNVETNEYCIYCMLCADVCPMQAISDSNPYDIDHDTCIRCGSCIRVCPAQAKSFTQGPLEQLQDNLLRPLCDTRKEPWYVIG